VMKIYRARSNKSKIRSRGGFTLLEVIIAITILSLIMVIIGSAFRLGIQAWGRGEKETEDGQRLRALSSLLSQQLKSIYPYRINPEDKDGVLLYKEGLLPDKKFEEHIKDKNREEIVDTHIDKFQFSYREPYDDEWMESWDDEEEVPGSVRVVLSDFQPFVIEIPEIIYGERADASMVDDTNE
jgi:prepilin-type N-terminal cleavage/methylation domain-containing protein